MTQMRRVSEAGAAFGGLLRRFRGARRLTQEQLASDAEISTRHLSFLETGKALPSREMVLVLASALELELRDRNVLLGAAGYAAVYRASPLDAPQMAPVRRVLGLLLKQQEPFGAVVVDRAWNVLLWNEGARRLFQRFLPQDGGTDARALGNVMHALFAPGGLRRSLVNWEQVASLALERLDREIALRPHEDEHRQLREAILAYPDVAALLSSKAWHGADPFVPLHLRQGEAEVRLLSTLTTLGTAQDITAQELTIESYFPADEASEAFLRAEMSGGRQEEGQSRTAPEGSQRAAVVTTAR